jgi:NTE family protein
MAEERFTPASQGSNAELAAHLSGDHKARPVRYRDGVRRPRWSGYTAFVLSGGGARGALQVGALRALLEHGERPDLVVGTSIGAWNGALLARTPTPAGVETLAEIWKGLTPARVLLGRETHGNPPPSRAGLLMLAAARRVTQGQPSLYGDTGLRQLLVRLVGDLTFADLGLPLRVIAANLTDGARTIFNTGPLAPTMLASSAIPGIFPPVRVGGSVYVDGGALDNVSLDVALALGARRLFILDVGYDMTSDGGRPWSGELAPGAERLHGTEPHALVAVLERTAQVMSHYHLEHALKQLPRGIEFHVIRPPTPEGGGVLDFGRGAAWIEHAYTFTREYLRAALPEREPATAAMDGAAAASASDVTVTLVRR